MEEVEITIIGWEKYNNRKDIKHPSWFRMENRFYCSQSLFNLTIEEKYGWICILSIASQKNSETIRVKPEWFELQTGFSSKRFLLLIDKLARDGCVRMRTDPYAHVTDAYAIDTRHNITDITDRQDITGHDTTRQDTVATRASPVVAPATVSNKSNPFFVINNSERIRSLYPDPVFVDRETKKMEIWLLANKNKSPKSTSGWTRFVMGWLERGWDQYRKTLHSKPVEQKKTWQEIVDEREKGHGKTSL